MKVVEKIIKKAEMGRAPSEIATMWRATSLRWAAIALLQVFTLTAYAATATRLNISGMKVLNTTNRFLVNGEPASSGTLNGSTCTAEFVPATGTLKLWNYIYSGTDYRCIQAYEGDLTIELTGTNTITLNAGNTTARGITVDEGASITVTAANAATLTMNLSNASSATYRDDVVGIYAGQISNNGVVTIAGKSNVTVNAYNTTSGAYAYGIYASRGVSISGEASFTANTTAVNGYCASGIYAGNSTVNALPSYLNINTTGNLLFDCSGNAYATIPVYGISSFAINLTRVGVMTLKWVGDVPHGGTLNYDANNFTVSNPDATTRIYTWTAGPPAITTASLPGGAVGTAYSQTLAATGTKPITWTIVGGSLPGGLSLSSAGVISGTPSATGTFNFTVQVANGISPNATKSLSIVIAPALSITTASLPGGVVGKAYSQTLAAIGATPITWTIVSGSLPGGLSLSSAGVISGTPSASGTFTFIVKAVNGISPDATKWLSIVIAPPLTFTDSPAFDIPAGMVNTAITPVDVSAGVSGGYGARWYGLVNNPEWLHIDYNTGVITGTRPSTPQAAVSGVTVQMGDESGAFLYIFIDVGAVITAPITVGAQSGPVKQGVYCDIYFDLTTTGIPNGVYAATVANLPAGFNVGNGGVVTIYPDGSGYLSVGGSTAASGTITMTLTINGSTSAPFTLTITPAVSAKLGDINGDGDVNAADLSILLANFGKSGAAITNPAADLNKDGDVNAADLSILLANFGK